MGEGARPEKEKVCVKSAVRRFRCMPRTAFRQFPPSPAGNASTWIVHTGTRRSLPFPLGEKHQPIAYFSVNGNIPSKGFPNLIVRHHGESDFSEA